ncbi:Nucleotide-binding universal stress protein, UspA family [Friedmanniella luteola]|uniref:Nucleotide-binding universal stress protein, UspA family n=1 Tax=Friedmanniella luteola TaxID=546871 RepID=A0A1H1L970_9ACTN|nr:universal stress protein [Friedmanniella luteola]SDR70967.1 Nucleotide-binding universal stress protein, UspA family [Friedmanniella luteola]
MTVALAHQASSPIGRVALREAAREAQLRATDLAVIHVVESVDLDLAEAHRAGLADEVAKVLADCGLQEVPWRVELAAGGNEDIANTVLAFADEARAELLVIGARRRSPVGKFLLGSVTQTIILDADMPVVVVKENR